MKILIAMSGGVDSSVAAGLLCRDGNECIGATMKLYHNEDAGIPRAYVLLARRCGGREKRLLQARHAVLRL